MSYLLVFVGGGIGAALRHGASSASYALIGDGFPAGTLFVNVLGSLVLGLLIGWFALSSEPSQSTRLFLVTGILGGFTTFSTFTLDTVSLWMRGDHPAAAGYAVGSVVLSIVGLVAGLVLMKSGFR